MWLHGPPVTVVTLSTLSHFQKILCNWNAISHWFGFRNWKEDNVAKNIPGILWISDKYHQYPRISCKMLIYVESKVFPVSNIFIAYLLLWIILDFFASFNCSVGDALCLFLFVHFFIIWVFCVITVCTTVLSAWFVIWQYFT